MRTDQRNTVNTATPVPICIYMCLEYIIIVNTVFIFSYIPSVGRMSRDVQFITQNQMFSFIPSQVTRHFTLLQCKDLIKANQPSKICPVYQSCYLGLLSNKLQREVYMFQNLQNTAWILPICYHNRAGHMGRIHPPCTHYGTRNRAQNSST